MSTVQKTLAWALLELCLVQILVVVANIQMRILKTEVEKGSVWTTFVHGLVDPNLQEKSFQQIAYLNLKYA